MFHEPLIVIWSVMTLTAFMDREFPDYTDGAVLFEIPLL
jgi:hypothetical protein